MVLNSSKLHPDTEELQGALVKIEIKQALLFGMSSEPVVCNFSLEVKEQTGCFSFERIFFFAFY